MGTQKGKKNVWQIALAGGGLSIGIYGGLIAMLSYSVVCGAVPENAIAVLLTLSACLSVLLGGVVFGRRLPVGIMGGCLCVFAEFWLVLFLLAWGVYGGVAFSSGCVPLLLSSLAGAVFSGVICRKQKGRRIAKRFG